MSPVRSPQRTRTFNWLSFITITTTIIITVITVDTSRVS